MINNINTNPILEFLLFLSLYLNRCHHNDYIRLYLILVYSYLLVVYNCGYCFCNLSFYYQTINYLNSKNNVVIMSLFFILVLLNKKKLTNNMFVVFFIFLFFLYSPLTLNQQVLLWLTNKNNININLTNGIMLIHPYILYVFYAAFIYLFLSILVNLFFLKRNPTMVVKNINKLKAIKIIIIIYISIILGCLWAEQELSWGGWWSWDFVELLALNYFILFLVILHKNNINLNCFNFFFRGLFLIIVAILFVRFNIINSIHNFINVESQNQYYYYVIFFIFLFFIYIIPLFKKINIISNLKISHLFLFLLFILYYLFIYNLILVGLVSLIENIQPNTKNVYILLLIFFLIIFFLNQIKYINLLLYWIILVFNFNLICVLLLLFFIYLFFIENFKKRFILKLIHMLFFLFFFIVQQQLYIFYPELIYTKLNSIEIIKTTSNLVLCKCYLLDIIDFNNTCVYTYLNYDLYTCLFDFSSGLNKSIFEKNVFISANYLRENYSYNFQKLIQTVGFIIFVILGILSLLLLIVLVKKIKISI